MIKNDMYRAARRASFADVPETCPDIDKAEEAAIRHMSVQCENALAAVVRTAKQKTEALRDALEEAHARIIELEEKLEDANNEIKRLEKEVKNG